MSTFKADIPGMKAVIDKIARVNSALAEGVVNVLDEGMLNIEREAKANAPMGKTGALKASISADVSERYSKSITVGVPYGAFVEFGTGSNVFNNRIGFVFSPEVREFAREFYVNGKGRMEARPYVFPALEAEKLRIIARIKKLFEL